MTQKPARGRRKLTEPPDAAGVPLSRALSKLGVLSRKQAVEAIRAGRVSVDGRVVRRETLLVVPERVRLRVDGTERRQAPWRAMLFHKPRGVVTTRHDPEGRQTVFDVLGEPGSGLVAVGRLDLATSGLLLLTSDTRLADWITEPAHRVVRVYIVTVRGRVEAAGLARLPPGVTVRKASGRETHLTVELYEGRNRQVRRMFDAIGHQVTRLKRVKLGGLELGDLPPGGHRELLRAEIAAAFPGAPVREV
jgi:23S rRNA pseudouridine2605 synthase